MRSHRSLLAWSIAAALAATLALPARAQIKEADRDWIEASIHEAVRPFEEAAAAAKEEKRKADEEQKGDTPYDRDRRFLNDWWRSFLLGSLKVSADGTYTNVDEWKSGPGLGSSAATEIDQDTFIYGVEVGFSGKPLARDIYLLIDHWSADPDPGGKFPHLDQYRRWGKTTKGDSWKRWALLDAFTFTGGVRFGTVFDDPSGEGNSTTSQKGSYSVSVTYALPLEKFRSPFME